MKKRNLRELTAAIVLPMVSSAALAQFTLDAAPPPEEPEVVYMNEVTFGAGYTTIDSFKFGEYSGIDTDGGFPIADIVLLHRPAYDSDEPAPYWEVDGTNLGLKSRSLRGEYGEQGNYELFIEYDQIPHNQFNDGATPFVGAGGTNLTLPPGWTPALQPSNMPDLLPSLNSIEVETERQNLGAGLIKHLNRSWKIGADFHHDTKDGIDTIGAAFGTAPGNVKAMILPEPIDYETNRANIFAEYVDRKSMFRFSYELSSFTNHADTLTFQNPYSDNGFPAGASVAFPNGVGEMALEPDNLAHFFSVAAARTIGMTSRLTANLSYSLYEQDETFLPYTANPLLTVTTPAPRSSLDGSIATTIFDLGYSSRPVQKLDVAARYRYEHRNNDTPSDTYIYIAGDAENQDPGNPERIRVNLPYGSGDVHRFNLDGGYRLMSRTKLSLGYEYKYQKRDYSEVETTHENTFSAKISGNPSETTSGWISYALSLRDGSTYQSDLLFQLSEPGGTPPDNDPRLRKYNIADRVRDEVKAVLSYMPDPMYSVSLNGAFVLDDYDDTQIGLTEQQMASVTLDFSVNPTEDITANAYATYENLMGDQNGCEFNPFAAPNCADNPPLPSESWTTETEDNIITFGIGADWQYDEKLSFGTDISFSRALTEVSTTGGAGFTPPPQPLPDIVSQWYSLGAHVSYKVKKDLEARFGYAYENMHTDDFAVDGVSVDTLDDVITLGESSPNYHGHIFSVALSYKF